MHTRCLQPTSFDSHLPRSITPSRHADTTFRLIAGSPPRLYGDDTFRLIAGSPPRLYGDDTIRLIAGSTPVVAWAEVHMYINSSQRHLGPQVTQRICSGHSCTD